MPRETTDTTSSRLAQINYLYRHRSSYAQLVDHFAFIDYYNKLLGAHFYHLFAQMCSSPTLDQIKLGINLVGANVKYSIVYSNV